MWAFTVLGVGKNIYKTASSSYEKVNIKYKRKPNNPSQNQKFVNLCKGT